MAHGIVRTAFDGDGTRSDAGPPFCALIFFAFFNSEGSDCVLTVNLLSSAGLGCVGLLGRNVLWAHDENQLCDCLAAMMMHGHGTMHYAYVFEPWVPGKAAQVTVFDGLDQIDIG